VESNSTVARYIRCAVAEAVVAQELAKNIFRDFYVGDKEVETELSDLRKALTWLNKEHQQEAAIIRCQLVHVCNKSSKVNVVATQVAQDVCAALCCWLNDTAREQFMEGLKGIFVDALRIWQHLQRTLQGAMAVMDPNSWIEQADARPEYDIPLESGQNSQQQPISELIDPLAILFPQVLVGKEVLFHGFALFHTQTAVTVASLERNGQQSLRRTTVHLRRTSDMDRRSREQGIATQVPNNASGGVVPQRRPSGNSQLLQARADRPTSVSSKGRRPERGSGD
jgi:hypothetical protein